jgi:hypothetical protein
VKSVLLLYECETWLVTSEIRRNIRTFVNRCLRYILRIWCPKIISNKDLWRVTGQEDINLEIRKRKFKWIGHTLRKEDGEVPKAALLWNPQGREEDLRLAGEDRSPKWVEAGTNYGSWRLIDRSGKNLHTTYVPKGTTDSIIIIIMFVPYHQNTEQSTLKMQPSNAQWYVCCTTCFNIKLLDFSHTVYLWVPDVSQNKQIILL